MLPMEPWFRYDAALNSDVGFPWNEYKVKRFLARTNQTDNPMGLDVKIEGNSHKRKMKTGIDENMDKKQNDKNEEGKNQKASWLGT